MKSSNNQPKKRIRLLIISPYPVFPPESGGKIRIVELAEHLYLSGISVTVVTPYKPGQRNKFNNSKTIHLKEIKYPFILPLLFTDYLFPYGYLCSVHPGYGILLKKFLKSFDVFQFEHVFFGDLLNYIPSGKPVLYDAHNIEYDYCRSECGMRAIKKIVGKRIYRLEKALVQAAAITIACSEEEKSRFVNLYEVSEKKIKILPNGIKEIVEPNRYGGKNTLFEKFPQLKQFPMHAIFSGSNVEHNRNAVKFIIEKIAPALQQECAFIIHGRSGKSFVKQKCYNVFFDLAYNEFERYAHSGAIGLSPMTQGAGTNLKLLHYLAHGLQVISTDFGMRGYEKFSPFVLIRPIDGFVDALKSMGSPPTGTPPELRDYLWEKIAFDLGTAIHKLYRQHSVINYSA